MKVSGFRFRVSGRRCGSRTARVCPASFPVFVVVMMATAFTAGSEAAAQTKTYNLQDCLRIGLEHSGTALNAARDEDIAYEKMRQARSLALPKLALSANYTRLDEVQEMSLGDETVDMGELDNYSVLAEVNQLIFSGGNVSAAIRAARLTRSYADRERSDVLGALVRDITRDFNNLLLMNETISVQREQVAQFRGIEKEAGDRLEAGNGSEFDAIRARVSATNAAVALLAVENVRDVAMESLRRTTGIGPGEFDIAGALEYAPLSVDAVALEKTAVEKRANLSAMKDLIRLREEEIISARSHWFPSVTAFGDYNGANAYRFAAYNDQFEWHWSAGARLTWDVWDGDLTRGLVREKQLELAKARTNLEEMEKAVALQVRTACLDLHYAAAAVEAGRSNVGLAEKALEIASTRYREGMATHLEFSEANVALSTARNALLQSVCRHLNAVAELEYASGTELDGIVH